MRDQVRWGSLVLIALALGCNRAVNPPVTSPASPTSQAIAGHTPAPGASAAPTIAPSGPLPWVAFGDSITQDAFAHLTVWASAFPGPAPTVVNAAIRGDTTSNALTQIDGVLAANPTSAYVTLAFGTNDAYGVTTPAEYEANMGTLVAHVRAAGKVPVVPTIPYSPHPRMTNLPAFNQAIADLRSRLGVPAGPDLYSWLQAHPDEILPDQIHMTAAGSQDIQRLWAQTAATLTAH